MNRTNKAAQKRATRTPRDKQRRELSQNFLTEQGAKTYLKHVIPAPEGILWEIGAGSGTLTRPLSTKCKQLIAVELDPHWFAHLLANTADLTNVEVLRGDALQLPLPQTAFHAVGNLPFSRTSALISRLLQAATLQSACVITQREYARKHTGDYGRWSRQTVLTWPEYNWTILSTIPRYCFRPMPSVDASVLRIERRANPLIEPGSITRYRRIVTQGFLGKGGTLYKSLNPFFERRQLQMVFEASEISRDEVVAFVSPSQWIALANGLGQSTSKGDQRWK